MKIMTINIKGTTNMRIHLVLIIVFLMTIVECFCQDKITMENINNENIKFGLIPRGRGDTTMKIKVIEPIDAVGISKNQNIEILESLLIVMENEEDKDWAANIIIYSILRYDALELLKSQKDINSWKELQKEKDVIQIKRSIEKLKSEMNH